MEGDEEGKISVLYEAVFNTVKQALNHVSMCGDGAFLEGVS